MPTTCLVIFFVLLNTCLCQELLKNDMIEFTTSRNFSGKVVLITESSAGVGRVIAALFSRLGAQLVVVGKDGNVVRQTSKDLQELSPFRLKVSLIIFASTHLGLVKRLVQAEEIVRGRGYFLRLIEEYIFSFCLSLSLFSFCLWGLSLESLSLKIFPSISRWV